MTPISDQIAALRDHAGPNDKALQDAIRTLGLFERFEPQARKFFSECLREESERRRAAEHPAVKAVMNEFEDAEIVW